MFDWILLYLICLYLVISFDMILYDVFIFDMVMSEYELLGISEYQVNHIIMYGELLILLTDLDLYIHEVILRMIEHNKKCFDNTIRFYLLLWAR